MTKFKTLLAASFLSLAALANTTTVTKVVMASDGLFGPVSIRNAAQKVYFLDSYGQLNAYMGVDGIFYVREAGKGQGADPTVKSGWATYVWDTRSRSWKITSKNDLFAIDGYDFSSFLKRTEYNTDIQPWKNRVRVLEPKVATNAADIIKINQRIDNLPTNSVAEVAVRVTTLEGQMAEQQTTTATLTTRANTADAGIASNVIDIAELKGRTTVAEGKITALETYKASNDVEIANLKAKDAELAGNITSAIATANAYTDGKAATLDARISREKLDLITNTAVRVHALENRVTNRINQVEASIETTATAKATQYAGIAKTEAIEASEAFTTNKVDTALTQAKSYTDGKVSAAELTAKNYTDTEVYNVKTNLTDKYTKADTATLEAAKTYSKSNLTKAKAYTDDETVRATKAEEKALEDAKSYTDGEIETTTTKIDKAISKGDANTLTAAKTFTSTATNGVAAIAAADATAKAGAAEAAAKTHAESYADTQFVVATNSAIAYTTSKLDATDKAQLEAGTTKFATKKNLEDVIVGSLVFPLKIKKGDIEYTLDVIDDGSGDITLKITK